MVVVLVAVAVITGGLLAWVNNFTAEPIKVQKELVLAEGIKSVMGLQDITVAAEDTITRDVDGKEQAFVVHKIADASGKFMGAAVESSSMGFGGELKLLVGFDESGKVLGYTVLQHAETPGLGAKADKWFQKGEKGDIIGRDLSDGKPLVVNKDGGDIDAITASTITSRAFLAAVKSAYDQLFAGGADATSGATSQKGKYSADEKQEESKENAKTTEN